MLGEADGKLIPATFERCREILRACIRLKRLFLFLMILAAALVSSSVFAADNSAQIPTNVFSIAATAGRSLSLYNYQDGTEKGSWDYSANPSYELSKTLSLSGLFEYSYDTVAETGDYGRGLISLTQSGYQLFGDHLNVSLIGTVGLPISKSTYESSLQASTSAGIKASVNNSYFVTKKLDMSFAVKGTKNFHAYETNSVGQVNTSLIFTESSSLSWSFNDRLQVIIEVYHFNTVSYFGTYRDFLSHNEELDIKFSPQITFALGHSWGLPYVSTLKANGQDFNFNLADAQNSIVYAQIGVTY